MNKAFTHNYWMSIAEKIGQASTCHVKLGCLLIQNNHIVGVGYPGSVSGDYHCNEHGCLMVPVTDKGSSGKSCIRTIHAEINAVLKCNVRGSKDNWITLYSTKQTCFNCFKICLQIGVRSFVFKDAYNDKCRELYIENLHPSIVNTLNIIKIK